LKSALIRPSGTFSGTREKGKTASWRGFRRRSTMAFVDVPDVLHAAAVANRQLTDI
jgi:hypothetical protein